MARSDEKYLAWLDTVGAKIAEPKPGDIITFRYGRCFSHSGIMINKDEVVHAYAVDRQCITTRLDWPDLARRKKVYHDFWARLRA